MVGVRRNVSDQRSGSICSHSCLCAVLSHFESSLSRCLLPLVRFAKQFLPMVYPFQHLQILLHTPLVNCHSL
jgi:hypothetical protein